MRKIKDGGDDRRSSPRKRGIGHGLEAELVRQSEVRRAAGDLKICSSALHFGSATI
ncbi:hypothetical protein [Bradyrhizobium sp. WSM3983]|uniref:hypothetical protein n=1 Tax=Bradyrhizobium sp. WSM3983 TaxID=1038867 RepID=UPI0012EBA756|nr:hypothetical protein [Bradyrhizobium sp. WSM3983]